jgi:hypothetical protein
MYLVSKKKKKHQTHVQIPVEETIFEADIGNWSTMVGINSQNKNEN